VTPSIHITFERNLQILNLLQTPIIPSIAHIFVKAIQGGCVQKVTETTLNSIHKYGTTICFDGWDNVAQCPLLNIMLVRPSGNVFIGSIDTTGEWKDVHYICNTLVGYIETIKVHNIVQIYI
jgi:hypothetical protein